MFYVKAIDKVWSTPSVTSYIVWERSTEEEANQWLKTVETRTDTMCCGVFCEKPLPRGNQQMSYYDNHNRLIESVGEPDFENVDNNISKLIFGKYFL